MSRPSYPGADASFGLALDGSRDREVRERVGQTVVAHYEGGREVHTTLIARTVEGDTAWYHLALKLAPGGACATCHGSGRRPDHQPHGSNACLSCHGTGNAPVAPAEPGAPTCGLRIEECGGSCIRAPGHEGKHLCQGDVNNIPGSCPV